MKSTKKDSNSNTKTADAAKILRILKARKLKEQLPKYPSKT